MPAAQTLRFLLGPCELIHAQAGPRLLQLVRRGVVLLWIFKLLLDPIWRLADLPPEMIRLIGPLTFLSPGAVHLLFTAQGLTALWAASLAILVLCLTEFIYPLAATLAAILLTVYSCAIRAFGPPVHSDIVLLLAVYLFAAYAWSDRIASRGQKSAVRSNWSSYPLITIVVLLCLSYVLVGLNRLIAGGPGLFFTESMEVHALDAGLRGYYFNTNVGWHVPNWPFVVLMLELGFPVITLFEIAAPLCLAWPRFRLIFIPFMLSFHLLSLVVLNILFFDDMLLYLLLIDWSRRFPSLACSQDSIS